LWNVKVCSCKSAVLVSLQSCTYDICLTVTITVRTRSAQVGRPPDMNLYVRCHSVSDFSYDALLLNYTGKTSDAQRNEEELTTGVQTAGVSSSRLAMTHAVSGKCFHCHGKNYGYTRSEDHQIWN